MPNSFSYDGTDMSNYGLTLLPYDEPWMPKPLLSKSRPPQGAAEFHGVNFLEGIITLECLVKGSSTSDLHTKRDAIVLKLNPKLGNKRIDLHEITDRFWYGRLISSIRAPQKGDRNTRFGLTFETVNAAHSTTLDDDTFAIVSDPDTFDVDSGGAIGGTEYAHPTWYVRNTTGSMVTGNIVLANTTTGETLTWSGIFEDDRWLRIGREDAAGRFLYTLGKSDSTGADPTAETYSNVMSGYVSGDWPRLKPDVQNAMSITGLSAGTVRWLYRDRFI